MEAKELEQYDEWLADHMEELVSQYSGKVIAICEGQVAFAGDSEVEAYKWAREKGLKLMPLVLRVPCEEDVDSIL